jgi:diadenylate cyclase
MGISEVTDSLTVVVSEETGGISITKNGNLFRELNKDSFREMLINEFVMPNTAKLSSSPRWNWRGKRHG